MFFIVIKMYLVFSQAYECGVLAQEVAEVLPEAVKTTSTAKLKDGSFVPDLLMVNKERIFTESIGAVKELGNIAVGLDFND